MPRVINHVNMHSNVHVRYTYTAYMHTYPYTSTYKQILTYIHTYTQTQLNDPPNKPLPPAPNSGALHSSKPLRRVERIGGARAPGNLPAEAS